VAQTPWVLEYGPEELTPVGERQRYILGLSTRARYPTVFKGDDYKDFTPQFMAENFHVRSTNLNRTLNSAFSHMYGIYSPPNADEQVLPYGKKLPFESPGSSQYLPPVPLVFKPELDTESPLPFGIPNMPIHSMISKENNLYNQAMCLPLKDKLKK
jgi:hypothetical protein